MHDRLVSLSSWQIQLAHLQQQADHSLRKRHEIEPRLVLPQGGRARKLRHICGVYRQNAHGATLAIPHLYRRVRRSESV